MEEVVKHLKELELIKLRELKYPITVWDAEELKALTIKAEEKIREVIQTCNYCGHDFERQKGFCGNCGG
jgi:hypothetical protein